MTDETRTYDCGGVPVELTLSEESYKEYDFHKHDVFQTVLDLIYEFGSCAIYGDIRDFNA